MVTLAFIYVIDIQIAFQIMPFASMWLNLENIKLSEVSQRREADTESPLLYVRYK